MSTATSGASDDDAVMMTDVEADEAEPERRVARERMPRKTVLTIFLTLAAVALLALVAAVVAVLMSERMSAPTFRGWLYGALGVVVVVVIAEVVLLLVARPRNA